MGVDALALLKDAILSVDLLVSLKNCNGRIGGWLALEHLLCRRHSHSPQQRVCVSEGIWLSA